MQAYLLDETRAKEWNDLVEAEPSFSMMQSWEWGEVKKRLGWEAYRLAVTEGERLVAGAQVLVKRLPLGVGCLAYVPRGPFGRWSEPEVARLLFGQIHAVARQNRAIFLKIEPASPSSADLQSLFAELKFRPSAVTNQPCATIVMDISPEPEKILRSMRDSTRRKIQSTERKGVVARLGSADDLPTFYRLMQITARRAGFSLRSYEYFETEFRTFAERGNAALFLAEHEGQVLAAHIAYIFGRHAAFFHQASNNEVSNLNPNCQLVWEEIKWARSKGCLTYDLWGIPDEIVPLVTAGGEPDAERTDGLWGVYRFKSGFSKNIVCYLGAMDYVYSPLLYRALTNKFLNQNTLEKISTWLDTHTFHRMENAYGIRKMPIT